MEIAKKIVEFMGMPASGKSTHVDHLCQVLQSLGQNFLVVRDRDVQFKEGMRFAELNRLRFLHLVEQYRIFENSGYKWLIFDRGFLDRTVWPSVDLAANYCTRAEYNGLQRLFRSFQVPPLNHIFLFMITPEEALQRHSHKKNVEAVDKYIMTSKYLRLLYIGYTKLKRRLPAGYIIINGKQKLESNRKIIMRELGLNTAP